jgi:hypothetical protein
MTGSPDDHQPEQPADAAAGPGLPSEAEPLEWPDGADCLTSEELAELAREEWELIAPDLGDYAEDPLAGPPGYSAAEEQQMLAEDDERARRRLVPEAIDAGFTHSTGGNGNGFAAGGPLDRLPPGTDLGWHVIWEHRRGLDTLTDDQLAGLGCANRRQKSLHDAIETGVVAELDRRRTAADGTPGEHVTAETAAMFTLTSWSAEALLSLSRELSRLPKTRVLLAHGIIDIRRAGVIGRHTGVLSDQDAATIEDLILPRASEMTTGELNAACLRAVITVDPAAARKRKEKALKDARVEAWSEESGTAAIAGRDLPPAEVITADKHIDAIARWLKTHGTQGTLDHIRAQVYLALLNDQPIESLLPHTPDSSAGAPPATSTTQTPDTRTSDTPTQDPATPDTGTPDPATPDTRTPDPATPGTGTANTSTKAQATTSTGRRDTTTSRTETATTDPATGAGALSGTVHLVMPYDTWAGRSDNPGDIAGYGTADAGTCRDLAHHMTTSPATRWCITLTDRNGQPVSHGCARAGPGPPPTDPGTWLAAITIHPIETQTCTHLRESAAYQPSNLLRHIIKTRSPRCGFPGSRRPATRCDDDHSIPYHLGGRTCECNLYPLCRTHHQCKQAPRWHLDQPHPGHLIWTTPTGRTYTKITEPYPV